MMSDLKIGIEFAHSFLVQGLTSTCLAAIPVMEFFRINRPTIVPYLEAKRVLRPISGIETASFAFLRPAGLSKRELLLV